MTGEEEVLDKLVVGDGSGIVCYLAINVKGCQEKENLVELFLPLST